MFYIKLDDELNLVITVSDVIRRGDNLSKKVIYLIPAEISSGDASINVLTASFYLSYLRADGLADIVELERMPEMYNASYYQYTFPITCKLTRFPGEVITWLQIYDGDAEFPKVAKSGECILRVQASKNADDYLYADRIVTALYQYKKRTDEQIEGTNERIDQIAAEKADGVTFDSETGVLQLMSGDEPIGEPVIIRGTGGKQITNVEINEDGELVISFDDGTVENLGVVVGKDGKVYVPHLDEHHVLTWTIEDEAGEVPDPVDINPDDEWSPIDDESGESDYTWEPIG